MPVRLAPLTAGNVDGNRASGIVPLARLLALRAVRALPLSAGNVEGKRASGTVPLARLEALSAVIAEPAPLSVVAARDVATIAAAVSVPENVGDAARTSAPVPVVPTVPARSDNSTCDALTSPVTFGQVLRSVGLIRPMRSSRWLVGSVSPTGFEALRPLM